MGRFTSADSIVPAGVQGYDRYAYGLNNPSRYTDPSGHRPCDDTDKDGNCITYSAETYIKSLLRLALENPDHPDYGNSALREIADKYGIMLSPDDHWAYEPFIIQVFGSPNRVGGYTPKNSEEEFFAYSGGPSAIEKHADDSAVYMTGELFSHCSLDISCIAKVMLHEAVHSWVEYKAGDKYDTETTVMKSNGEILAEEFAVSVFGNSTDSTDFINNEKRACKNQCGSPQSALETFYGITLSDLAVSIMP